MRKLTVTEYAQTVGLTREAIHYQIKQKKLNYKKIKGKFFILVDNDFNKEEKRTKAPSNKEKELLERIKSLEEQNIKLQEQIENKENIINLKDRIIQDKETIIESKEETIEADKRTNIVLMDSYKKLQEQHDRLIEDKTPRKKRWVFF